MAREQWPERSVYERSGLVARLLHTRCHVRSPLRVRSQAAIGMRSGPVARLLHSMCMLVSEGCGVILLCRRATLHRHTEKWLGHERWADMRDDGFE